MYVLSERQEMIIQAINNREFLMSSISDEKYNELISKIGEDALTNDVYYLVQAGLINPMAIVHSKTGGFILNKDNLSLTAAGVDCANADTLGNKLNVVNIKIHENTINNLEAMIKAVNLPDEDKQTLLSMVKEKGAEVVVGRMVDYAFANAGIATKLFIESAKNKLGFHD